MTKWLKRIRGALLMGVTWAVLWAPVGVLIGMVVDPTGARDEPWLLVGAYPGFLGGVAFAAVLGIAGRRRRFGELSLSWFAAWGAAGGLLVGGLWLVVALASDPPRWLLHSVVVGALTVLSSVSAAGSLALARRAEGRERAGAGATVDEAGLAEGERPEGLPAGDPTLRRPLQARRPATT